MSASVKRLKPEQVARMDAGRDRAEQEQGRRGRGRPRKDGSPAQPRAKTIEEAKALVKSEAAPPKKVGGVKTPEPEWREPTRGEIDQIKFFMKMGNKPLEELEHELESMGVVGPEVPPALAKKGSIPASDEELEMGASCTAGTLITFAPSLLPYMAPIGLAMFTIGFVGSRLMIFLRIKRAMDAEQKAKDEEAERRKTQVSKTNTGAVPGNGTITKLPEHAAK